MNTKLLLQIKEAILNDAESFDMAQSAVIRPDFAANLQRHGCFTQACIAGWAIFLQEESLKALSSSNDFYDEGAKGIIIGTWWDFFHRSRNYLEIDERSASRLFHKDNWPSEFNERIIDGPSTKEEFINNAQTAADYIDYFIAQEGNV